MSYWKGKCERYWLSRNGGFFKRLSLAYKYDLPKLYEECLLITVTNSAIAEGYMDPNDNEYEDEETEDETFCQVLALKVDCFEKRFGPIPMGDARSYMTKDYWGHLTTKDHVSKLQFHCVQVGLSMPLEQMIYMYDRCLIDRETLSTVLAAKVLGYEKIHDGYICNEEATQCIQKGFRTSFPKVPECQQTLLKHD